MIGKISLMLLTVVLVFVSCEQPMDPVIKSVEQTKALLHAHHWHVDDFSVEVKDKDIPPPILWNLADSLSMAGIFDLDDMVFDASEMRKMIVEFTPDGKIVPLNEETQWLKTDDEHIASYFVINDQSLRIKNDKVTLHYKYFYYSDENQLLLTVTENEAASLISDINKKLIDRISNQSPDKLADIITSILYNNEALHEIINNALVDMISGKLDFINDINPDEASKYLAEEILMALQSIDWETKLTEILKEELEKITGIDAEAVAQQMSTAIALKINESLSVENIYDFVLPYLDNLVSNPEQSSEQIAQLIVQLFFTVFNQDNLQAIISHAWADFTMLEDERVAEISSKLTNIVQDLWINEDALVSLLLPFTLKIDETSILKMGELADQATESIRVVVGKINETFPDLNLTPDYENLNSSIKTIFIAAKPAIGLAGGPEKAAQGVANIVLDNFITTELLNNTFSSTIKYLQTIDADMVGEKIASWLVNLEEKLAPEIIENLKQLFGPILENINPEFTAFKIAKALNGFIGESVTPEALNSLIYPILKAFTEINAEAVANFIAVKLLESDLINGIINQENLVQILLPVLTAISDSDTKEIAQSLINAILNTGIFEDILTEERASTLIAVLIYNASWEEVKIVNNFKEATIILRHE
ncbi:hypothetical protein [Maribellus sediminis]|uniref:hypothetical protein n=1 Tax=Maribellus sediminis TaxID=2696285 RepID=UPI0014320773|nr:hypothetical protein [Maribellus sediminis]